LKQQLLDGLHEIPEVELDAFMLNIEYGPDKRFMSIQNRRYKPYDLQP